jgi:hypothetical protein
MSCCGKNRQAWRNWSTRTVSTDEQPAFALRNPVALYHLVDTSMVVRGAVTGTTYLFSGYGTTLSVDERDAPELIATGQFATVPPK